MPPPINEVDVDYEAQIQEIRRLISSTSDQERRLVLEDQLRELELASVQQENQSEIAVPMARQERRKSFRPPSAKPRMAALTSLAEDKEVHLPSVTPHHLEAHGRAASLSVATLVLDILATSFDDEHSPWNVLASDSSSFWMSSGLFPQVLRLSLKEPVALVEVEVSFRHVRELHLRTAPSRTNPRVSRVMKMHVAVSDSSKPTTHRFALGGDGENGTGTHSEVIELGIESSYSDFAIVYSVHFRQATPSESGER